MMHDDIFLYFLRSILLLIVCGGWVLQRSGKDIASPEDGVTDSCELPNLLVVIFYHAFQPYVAFSQAPNNKVNQSLLGTFEPK